MKFRTADPLVGLWPPDANLSEAETTGCAKLALDLIGTTRGQREFAPWSRRFRGRLPRHATDAYRLEID
jgi:hypothetical protein